MDTTLGHSTLEQLASDISAAAKLISAYSLVAETQPVSFGPNSPPVVVPSYAPQNVVKAQQDLIRAAAKIQQLATEPSEYIPNLQVHYQQLSCLRWLCHFNVLPCIPLEGSVPYSELASLASVPETQLRSICRMLMTSNFLCEPNADEVAHNNVSSTSITNPGFVDWVTFITQFSMPAAAHMTEATEKWGATTEKNETAVNLAMKTDMPLFDFISKSPEMTKLFAAYMKNVQNSEGTNLKHLVHGYDWASLGDSVVVDVGGSTCSSAIALASAYPSLRFVVQDLPDTVTNASQVIKSQPEPIRSRIAVHAYSFFSPQSVREAQVYLLRMILHDWPDQEALTILRNHLGVLKHDPRARLIIMDTVLPSLLPGQAEDQVRGHDHAEALLRVRDLTMMQSFNAKERELSEFSKLFTQTADEEGRLVLKNVVRPPGSVLSVLEVAYEKFDARDNTLLAPQPNRISEYTFNAQLMGRTSSVGSSHSSSSDARNSHDLNRNGINLSTIENNNMSTGAGIGMGNAKGVFA